MSLIKFIFQCAFIATFIVAWIVRFKINERRFERRNFAGLEQFETYAEAYRTRFAEGGIYWLCGVAQWVSVLLWAMIHTGFWH